MRGTDLQADVYNPAEQRAGEQAGPSTSLAIGGFWGEAVAGLNPRGETSSYLTWQGS